MVKKSSNSNVSIVKKISNDYSDIGDANGGSNGSVSNDNILI